MAVADDKTTVSASVTFVRNIGNFESVRIDLGMTRGVTPGTDDVEALRALYKEVESNVEKAVLRINAEAGLVNKVAVRRGN